MAGAQRARACKARQSQRKAAETNARFARKPRIRASRSRRHKTQAKAEEQTQLRVHSRIYKPGGTMDVRLSGTALAAASSCLSPARRSDTMPAPRRKQRQGREMEQVLPAGRNSENAEANAHQEEHSAQQHPRGQQTSTQAAQPRGAGRTRSPLALPSPLVGAGASLLPVSRLDTKLRTRLGCGKTNENKQPSWQASGCSTCRISCECEQSVEQHSKNECSQA